MEMRLPTILNDDDIAIKLSDYALSSRSSLNQHAIEYWAERKSLQNDLYELSVITNAVPMTQVSVERAFSALAFILNPYRNSLAPDTLENILLIKLNKDVFLRISPIDADEDDE